MQEDNVIELNKPETVTDLLTEVLRNGAQQLLAAAVKAKVEDFLSKHNQGEGAARFVRNGYLPEREIQTGIGGITVAVPRVRDRDSASDGISTNDFAEALTPLVGSEAKNLSPGVISRLKATWEDEYKVWQKRSLKAKRYVYFWADGIHLQARMEESAECVLVIIGVTEQGNKELLALEAGHRESKESWLCLLPDIKHRGLKEAPKLAVGDGALGFWGALTEIYGETKQQRCWFHKMGNVLDKLPKSLLAKAKKHLQEIWMAPTRKQVTVHSNLGCNS
jgi:transposase-like protein